MRRWQQCLVGLLTMVLMPLAVAQSPAGNWTTVDDQTGKKRSMVRLSLSGDTLNGQIIKVYPQPGDTGMCSKCPGAFKDKPIQGLQFLWGLKDKGNGEWTDGQILDPKTGKIYRAKLTVQGNKIYVRGYKGMSAFGRTQTWLRG